MPDKKPELVVALDIPDKVEAFNLAQKIADYPVILKIHWVLYPLIGHDGLKQIAEMYEGRIFLDFKLHDIPSVVSHGVRNLMNTVPFRIMNLHASGGMEMISQAVKTRDEVFESGCECNIRPEILAVTIVTSLGDGDLSSIGSRFDNTLDAVLELSGLAKNAGTDGVVASVHETKPIKEKYGSEFKVLTPGIRPEGFAKQDQARVATPSRAREMGSDYIVVGRPVTKSDDPKSVVEQILHELNG